MSGREERAGKKPESKDYGKKRNKESIELGTILGDVL
jgi:hypothetical protein